MWSEGDNCDYALSFQEKKGCGEVWEKICQVCILTILQHIESAGMTWQWYCVLSPSLGAMSQEAEI